MQPQTMAENCNYEIMKESLRSWFQLHTQADFSLSPFDPVAMLSAAIGE